MLKLLSYNYVNTSLLLVKMTILIDYVKKYIGDPTQSLSNYQNEADRHHNFCKLDNDFTSYCFPSKAGRLLGVWKVKCHPNCMIIPATTTATSKPSDIETRHRNIRHRNQNKSNCHLKMRTLVVLDLKANTIPTITSTNNATKY